MAHVSTAPRGGTGLPHQLPQQELGRSQRQGSLHPDDGQLGQEMDGHASTGLAWVWCQAT